jgi:hypothetical protein
VEQEIQEVDGNEDVPYGILCSNLGANYPVVLTALYARCVEIGAMDCVLQHVEFVCGKMSVIQIASPGGTICPRFLF